MRLPGSTPSIWRRLEALADSEFNSGGADVWARGEIEQRPPYREYDAKTRLR
jgi:hypothetical protein